VLGQEVHAQRITLGVVPQFDLGQHLVGEGGTHHEAAFVATVILGREACNDGLCYDFQVGSRLGRR